MRNETKKKIRIIGWILFIIYILLLIYFLFLSEEYGRKDFAQRDYQYNLVLFQEIRRFWVYRERVGYLAAFLNLAGNVIGFLPFGFILPVIGKRMKNGFLVTVCGFCLSLFVESMQLIFKVGSFDVDDLLLNTVGGCIGYFVYLLFRRYWRGKYGKKEL